MQYRLAGLELNEELPDVKDFPHRGLSRTIGSGDLKRKGKSKGRSKSPLDYEEENFATDVDVEDEEDKNERPFRGPWLRNRHLSVLTTLLHRCLQEGDIVRASRAWGMLLRVQISGRGIDIRSNGYWEIGAALLMRSLDQKRRNTNGDEENGDPDALEQVDDEDAEKRWGTREGLEKVKEYYERLILEFPYNRHFQKSISALDFWPAMVGCEIYGIQYDQRDGLRRVEKQEKLDDEQDRSGDESLESEEEQDYEEDMFAINQRRKEKIQHKRAEKRWVEREKVRLVALNASEALAARLDEVMTIPPYSDSHNMIRLRGMIALYVGDLSVPAMPIVYDDEDDEEKSLRSRSRLGDVDKNTERLLTFRRRAIEHDRGKKKQSIEHDRAAKLFDRIVKDGGEDDIPALFLGQAEQEDEDEYET